MRISRRVHSVHKTCDILHRSRRIKEDRRGNILRRLLENNIVSYCCQSHREYHTKGRNFGEQENREQSYNEKLEIGARVESVRDALSIEK